MSTCWSEARAGQAARRRGLGVLRCPALVVGPFTDAIEGLCQRVADDCADDQLRYEAMDLICMSYANKGQTERAVALIKRFPDAMQRPRWPRHKRLFSLSPSPDLNASVCGADSEICWGNPANRGPRSCRFSGGDVRTTGLGSLGGMAHGTNVTGCPRY